MVGRQRAVSERSGRRRRKYAFLLISVEFILVSARGRKCRMSSVQTVLLPFRVASQNFAARMLRETIFSLNLR